MCCAVGVLCCAVGVLLWHQTIAEDLARVGKECKLHGFEKVKDFYLSPEVFSVENNILTPTFKLKRNDAKKAYQKKVGCGWG